MITENLAIRGQRDEMLEQKVVEKQKKYKIVKSSVDKFRFKILKK